MRIAILGAGGFLGKNLSQKLLVEGHEIIGYFLEVPEGDVGYERRTVSSLLDLPFKKKKTFDITINLAARRSTKLYPLSTPQVEKFTFEIPREFIVRTASENTVVLNASTYIQNFEGFEGRTVDSYGASKQKLSKYLEKQSKDHGFYTHDLFFFTIYGKGDKNNHLIPLLLDAAKTGNSIDLSPGSQLMNLLYIDDAIQNILKCVAIGNEVSYLKSYLWTEEYFTVKELVARIEATVARQIDCRWGAREYAGHEMLTPWPIPMPQVPGFIGVTSLEAGIAEIWRTY